MMERNRIFIIFVVFHDFNLVYLSFSMLLDVSNIVLFFLMSIIFIA